jgi:hypothetical protein
MTLIAFGLVAHSPQRKPITPSNFAVYFGIDKIKNQINK